MKKQLFKNYVIAFILFIVFVLITLITNFLLNKSVTIAGINLIISHKSFEIQLNYFLLCVTAILFTLISGTIFTIINKYVNSK